MTKKISITYAIDGTVNSNNIAESTGMSTNFSNTEGVETLLDVLNSQQDYYRALGHYNTTKYGYMNLLQRFKQVMGSNVLYVDFNG